MGNCLGFYPGSRSPSDTRPSSSGTVGSEKKFQIFIFFRAFRHSLSFIFTSSLLITAHLTSKTSGSTIAGRLSTLSGSNLSQSNVSGASTDERFPDGRILEVPNLRVFTFSELKSATRNFRHDTVLGEGGFGKVYKGWVEEKTLNPAKSGLGMVVAVKKLNPESMQGLEQWQVKFPIIVKLQGI
ncbi:hypothetical protein BHE74_00006063 [Ensete ventricosum]|nr:hypothetical protein BHE74_00006063 [Ensete ventricosum]